MKDVGTTFMRAVFVLIAAMGLSVFAQAQQRVTGKVSDTTGEPIIGASVIVKGTTNGTVTNVNGDFTLNAQPGATLEISFVGYETQTVKAGPGPINVVLKEDTELLEEVIVVGYGTMKKSDLTGSATSLKSEAITSVIASNPIESLQGKSAGVAVFTNNKPGETPTIRVRGSSSINASNDPLFVVDGFPLVDADMTDINPADIESMEILKDASSTAIYGSRGANGVVMITTKSGARDTKNLTVSLQAGVQMRSRLVNMITGQDWLDYSGYDAPSDGKYTDWQREIINKTAITQNYNVTFDGGNKGTQYMLSFGYYNQDGLIDKQGFEKFSIHNNITHKYNSWLTVGSNVQVTISKQDVDEGALNELFRCGYPTEPVYNEDGSYNVIQASDLFNPIADIAATTSWVKSTRIIGNFFAQVDFNKHLSYKVSVGYDSKYSRNYMFKTTEESEKLVTLSEYAQGEQGWAKTRSKLMDHVVTYKNQWGGHRLTVTGVYSYQDYRYEDINVASQSFSNDLLGAWSISGVELTSQTSDVYSNKVISFAGRLSYAYNDKYLLTATARYDGSSRFGENNKWGLFPSVGIAWRATQEEFLKDNNILTDLKIRASYGITGNQEIGNYNSLSQLSTSTSTAYTDGTNSIVGYAETVGNANLKWERTQQIDLGFDLSLWDRINVNFDYYNRITKDLLYEVPIPSSSGYSTVMDNVGKVKNHGIELTIGANIWKNKDWSIDASFNMTYTKNEIKALYSGADRVEVTVSGSGVGQILQVGNPVNGVWGRKSLGIIKTQEQLTAYQEAVPTYGATLELGDEMFEDLDGDGSISSDDFICFGSIEPKIYYGFNLNVKYKKLSLSVYGQGATKYASITGAEDYYTNGTAWAVGYANLNNYLIYADNQVAGTHYIPSKEAYDDFWSTSNPDGNHPRDGSTGWLSDRTNADWHYFILKNIQLSYDFSELIGIKTLKNLTFNVNLQNFFTSATTNGYNPENGDVSNPWSKTIMFGLSAKF